MTIRKEMRDLFDRMASVYRAGDAVACAEMWTEDGVIYSPFAPPARGRAAIETLHRDWTSDGAGADKKLEVLDAGSDGNLVWCLASFAESDGAESGTGLHVLERQADGSWLIRASSLNSDAPV